MSAVVRSIERLKKEIESLGRQLLDSRCEDWYTYTRLFDQRQAMLAALDILREEIKRDDTLPE